MGNIVFNSWSGGISSHYHTGGENQCADMENIDITAHPDAIMLANSTVELATADGDIRCGFFLYEYIKKENIGFVFATDRWEIFYNNIKIATESDRVYKGVFYDHFTESKVKKKWIFLLHKTGIDRMEYDEANNTFINMTKNVDNFVLKAENVEKIPLLRSNGNVYMWVGNRIVAWDGVIFQNKIKLSDITRIVGLTAYGDYVHVYATDGENSYKAIYDPINDDDEQPWSMRNYGRMEFVSVESDGSVDVVVMSNDDIYQSSGLQVQPYVVEYKNIYREDKKYNKNISAHNGKIWIGWEKYLYMLSPGEVGMPPKISKWNVWGKIDFLYGSKEKIFVWSEKKLLELSLRAGENVVETGEYITLWRTVTKYAHLTSVDIEINAWENEEHTGGYAEVYARTSLSMEWVKLWEYRQNVWVQEVHKNKLNDTLKNWHEIQFKIVLHRWDNGKSPIFYTLNTTYDDSNI